MNYSCIHDFVATVATQVTTMCSKQVRQTGGRALPSPAPPPPTASPPPGWAQYASPCHRAAPRRGTRCHRGPRPGLQQRNPLFEVIRAHLDRRADQRPQRLRRGRCWNGRLRHPVRGRSPCSLMPCVSQSFKKAPPICAKLSKSFVLLWTK